MQIDPQDGGLDDWFVPASDGYPDDWFVPEADGYPNDWLVPTSSAASNSAPAAPSGSFMPDSSGVLGRGLVQPVVCQGPTCTQGGTYGTTGMYRVFDKNLCRDCAVKALRIDDLPAAEQTKILRPFLRG
jgi:hypothetical protein